MQTSLDPSLNAGWNFENSYTRLPDSLFRRVAPTPVAAPATAVFNKALAESLGLDVTALDSEAGAAIFAGNQLPPGADPIAQAYAGHQFGNFTMLGDGRAILLGEQITPAGRRFDIQLKGSGPTPFSRRGDGLAALGPMLREYLISEAMHALGIPTTRSLAVATTGEIVQRETPLPGAVLVRVAASHIRVGTFEFAAMLDDDAIALRAIADHTIARHYPDIGQSATPYEDFLIAVIEAQASLIAQWMSVGFIHGVMNTDNMALSGETIDYGPCAFMDTYDANAVFSSIDRQGRYAYANQPNIAVWNLARFAETLLPLLHPVEEQAINIAKAALEQFGPRFNAHWLRQMGRKIGLFTVNDSDRGLIDNLLIEMQTAKADFTRTFRNLDPKDPAQSISTNWHNCWTDRLNQQTESLEESKSVMQRTNPAVIPRNHLVEEALAAAVQAKNFTPITELTSALQSPFSDPSPGSKFTTPPQDGGIHYRTFCGT